MHEKSRNGDTPNTNSPQMLALWSCYSTDERATKLAELFQAGRELMLAGIKLRSPDISEAQAHQELKRLLYAHYKMSHA